MARGDEGPRGSKRVWQLARELGVETQILLEQLRELDPSRKWAVTSGVPASIERRVRSLRASEAVEGPAARASTQRKGAPAGRSAKTRSGPEHRSSISRKGRRGPAPSATTLWSALKVPAGPWRAPDRVRLGMASVLLCHLLLTLTGGVGAYIVLRSRPAWAEWLATDAAYGHPLALSIVLAVAALRPVQVSFASRKSEKFRSAVGLLLRGVALDVVALLVLPGFGDLWNRAHGVALVLASVFLLSWLQFWNITARPIQWVLALLVRRSPSRLAAWIVRRIISLEPEQFAGRRKEWEERSRSAGATAPDWLLSSVEARADRSRVRLLGGPGEARAEAHAGDCELEFITLFASDPRDLERLVPRAVLRTASSVAISLHDAANRDASAMWPEIERRLKLLCVLLGRLPGTAASALREARTFLDDAVWADDICSEDHVLAQALHLDLLLMTNPGAGDVFGLAAGVVAIRLCDERVLGWAEAVASGVLQQREGAALDAGPIQMLATVSEHISQQNLLGALEGAHLKVEGERIRTETRLRARELSLFEASGRRRASRSRVGLAPLLRIPLAIRGQALGIRRERRVMHPLGARGFGVVTLAFFVLGSVAGAWGSRHAVMGSGPAIQVLDPFRDVREGFIGREVSASAVDVGTGELLLGTALGAHSFDPNLFKHRTEAIGEGGPSAQVQQLLPMKAGGVLARVGEGGTGLDVRGSGGVWETLISPPDRSIGSPEILDVATQSNGKTLFLTTAGLLLYEPSLRRLERVELAPFKPVNPVALAQVAGEFLLVEEDRILALERVPEGFHSRLVKMPTGLGLARAAHVAGDRLLIRTDRDALIALDAGRRWRLIAGGRQFEESTPLPIVHVVGAPESGSVAVVLRGHLQDEIRIRTGDERFWTQATLSPGMRVSDGDAPVISADGEQLLFVDADRGLQLVTRSAEDPLVCRVDPVLSGRPVDFLGPSPSGFVILSQFEGGLELRSGAWDQASDGGTRHRWIRPLTFEGEVVDAFPRPGGGGSFVVATSLGEILEYDLSSRSMVGDLWMLDPGAGRAAGDEAWVRSCSLSEKGLVVVGVDGVCSLYADPSSVVPGDPKALLGLRREMVSSPGIRGPGRLVELFDSSEGFEAFTEEGDAWEYSLRNGWRPVSSEIEAIDLGTMKRLSSGLLLALTRSGDVIWRSQNGWQQLELRLTALIPSTESLTGFDGNGAIAQVTSPDGTAPVVEVLADSPRPAGLTPPIRDVHADEDGQALWVAHGGGLSWYDISSGQWSDALEGVSGVRRIEKAPGGLYLEQADGQLLLLEYPELRVRQLVQGVRSWFTDAADVAYAVTVDHSLFRCEAGRVEPLVLGESELAQGVPRAVTGLEDALVVLEKDRLLIGGAGRRFRQVMLPCEDPLAVATTGSELLILGGGEVYEVEVGVLDAREVTWRSTGQREVRELIELSGAVIAIGADGSVWRYQGPRSGFRAILHGPVEGRQGQLVDRGTAVQLGRGLWLRTADGVIRWDPDGQGGQVEVGAGELRVIGGDALHWNAEGVRRLSGLASIRAVEMHAGDLTHVMEVDGEVGVVEQGAIRILSEGSVRSFMGQSPGRDGAVVDLQVLDDGRFAVLTGPGDVQVYDPARRRFDLEFRAWGPVGEGRLHLDGDGTLVLQTETGDLIGRLHDGRSSSLEGGRGVALSQRRPIGLSASGQLMEFFPLSGWRSRGPEREGGEEVEVSDRLMAGDRLWLILGSGELLSYTGGGEPLRAHALDGMRGPRELIPLSGERALVLGEEDADGNTPVSVLGSGQPQRMEPGKLVPTSADPLIVDADNRGISRAGGERLWNALESTVQAHEPVDLIPGKVRDEALVLDAAGIVHKYWAGRSTIVALDSPAVPGARRLFVDREHKPVIFSRGGELHFEDGEESLASGSEVLQGRNGVWWIDTAGRLRRDRGIVPLTELEGWRPFGRFPLNLDRVEVIEAGGRTWARSSGGCMELLPDGTWRESDLSLVDFDRPILTGPDGSILGSRRDEWWVSPSGSGGRRTLDKLPAGAALVGGAETPMALVQDDVLLELPIGLDDPYLGPVALDPQAVGLTHAVELVSGECWIAVGAEGGVWRRDQRGDWSPIAGASTVTGELVVFPIHDEVPVGLLLDATVTGRARLRLVSASGVSPDLLGLPLTREYPWVSFGLDLVARTVISLFEGRLPISSSGLIQGVDRLEVAEGGEGLIYVGPSLRLKEAVATLFPPEGAERWRASRWSTEQPTDVDGASMARLGSWPPLVRREDGVLDARRPVELLATDTGNLDCRLENGDRLRLEGQLAPAPCAFRLAGQKGGGGLRPGEARRVELECGEEWRLFYRGGESRIAHDEPAAGPGKVVFTRELEVVFVNEAGQVVRMDESGTRRLLVEFEEGKRALTLELHDGGGNRQRVLVRGESAAWWLGPGGLDQKQEAVLQAPGLGGEIVDIEAFGLNWGRSSRWPRFDGHQVRLLGRCFEHELPLSCGDRAGSAAVQLSIGGEPFTRRLGQGGLVLSGGLKGGLLEQWQRTETAEHPSGVIILDRVSGELRLRCNSSGGPVEERWDSRLGAFPSERVLRAEWTPAGWVHLAASGSLVRSSPDFKTSALLRNLEPGDVVNLRSGFGTEVHALLASGTVLAVNVQAARVASVPKEDSYYSWKGIEAGYPMDRQEAGVAAARLGFSHGRSAPLAGEWLADRGCFEFEVVNLEQLELLGTGKSGRMVRVPSMAGPVFQGAVGDLVEIGEGVWEPAPTEVRGGGLWAERRPFSSGFGAARVRWAPGGAPAEIDVPWVLVDGLLPFDAIEGLSPGSDGQLIAWSRLGPRRVVDSALSTPIRLLDGPRQLDGLEPWGDFESWFGDYGDVGLLAVSGDVSERARESLGASLGEAISEVSIKLRENRSDLVVRRRATLGDRRIDMALESSGLERALQLTKDGFLSDLRTPSHVDGKDALAMHGGFLTWNRLGQGALLGHFLLAGGEIRLGYDDAYRERLELRRLDASTIRFSEEGLEPAAPLAVERTLQPRGPDGNPRQGAFELMDSDELTSRIHWQPPGASVERTLIEIGGQFAHDLTIAAATLEADQGVPCLVLATEGGQVALRSLSGGDLMDVSEADWNASRIARGPAGGIWCRTGEAWEPLILASDHIIGLGQQTERVLDLGVRTVDWALQVSRSPTIFVAGGPGILLTGGWLPGDRIEAFAHQGGQELLSSERGLRFRTSAGAESIVASADGHTWRSDGSLRGPVFVDRGGQMGHRLEGGVVTSVLPYELQWTAEASGIRLEGQALEWPRLVSSRAEPASGVGAGLDFLPGGVLPCDRVVGIGVRPEGLLILTPPGIEMLREEASSSPAFVNAGPAGLPGTIEVQGPCSFSPAGESEVDVWLQTDDGLVGSRWTGRTYEVISGAEPGGVLQEFLRSGPRWSLLRELDGPLMLGDGRGNVVMDCEAAIDGGALLQDRLLAIGADDEGNWLRTQVTLERGSGLPFGGWNVEFVTEPIAVDSDALLPAWASVLAPGETYQGSVQGPKLDHLGHSISASGSEVFAVAPDDDIYRLESGLWAVRARGELWWIKPDRRWYR